MAVLAAGWLTFTFDVSAATLWEIGKPDRDNREFAFAPNRFGELRHDGFFVVGHGDTRTDWPYVHPGPADGWAGARPHTFSVLFGLKSLPAAGECRLTLDTLDAHGGQPPEVRVSVNGRDFQKALAKGAGDASIFGEPGKGRPERWTVTFPAEQLRLGANEVALTTLSGSWFLYDALTLETPAGAQLGEVEGTVVSGIRSAPVLVERHGGLAQTIELTIRRIGEPTTAKVHATGAESQTVALRSGVQSVEVVVPAVTEPTETRVTVEVAGQPIATQSVTLKPVRKWVVYLLPHSHVDIGYTHVQTDVERAQWRYLELAIETARRTAGNPPGARFKWNVEVLWAVDSYLRQASPEKQQAFVEAVKAGWIGLQALYGNELTGLCSGEELLRLVGFAQRLKARVGEPIESAMITDVPGYTWGMVPAFAQSGIKYFSIGPNGGDRIGRTITAWGDHPFWWIGPNGRDRVLVWMTGTGYYQVFQSPEKLLDYLGTLDAKRYPYDLVQVRHCLGDNGAPDVNFADNVKAWNATHAYPRLVIATTAEMFRDFEQRYGAQLPVAQGDFTPYWEDGAASSARETALNRAAADRLSAAETLLALYRPDAYRPEEFQRAWRNVVLYDEHTWGAHNSISEPDAPFVKSQWAIKQAFALEADAMSRQLLAEADAARGALVGPAGAAGGTSRRQVLDVIATTSPGYGAYELVTVPRELSGGGDVVRTAEGKVSGWLTQRLTSGELILRPCLGSLRALRFEVGEGVPAAPARSFRGAQVEGATLMTTRSALSPGLSLRLDEVSGAIASLRFEGRELVATNAGPALNEYLYLPGSDVKGVQRNGPVKITVKEKGPLLASLLVESEAPGCRKLTREVRLHALRNYVEIIDTIDKLPVRAKEGVHVGFGFNVPGGVVRMETPWAVVRPEADQIPGACKNWFTVQRWLDVSNDKYGVMLVTPDAPLWEVGEISANLVGSQTNPDAWRGRVEPSQTLYAWVMNNHWHTNYRAEQEGSTVFRFFLVPHAGGYDATMAHRLAQDLTRPVLVLPARGELPKRPPLSIASTPSASVSVSAIKPSEHGGAWIVRLHNVGDEPAKVKLDWAAPGPGQVWLSDNSERPGERLEGPVTVAPRSLVTVRADRR